MSSLGILFPKTVNGSLINCRNMLLMLFYDGYCEVSITCVYPFPLNCLLLILSYISFVICFVIPQSLFLTSTYLLLNIAVELMSTFIFYFCVFLFCFFSNLSAHFWCFLSTELIFKPFKLHSSPHILSALKFKRVLMSTLWHR